MSVRDLFDRNGNPITMAEWGPLHADMDYKVVQQDELPNGRFVSTVWLGMNHNYGDGPPLIFETMIFANHDFGAEMYCDRYATEVEARAGHEVALTLAGIEHWHGYDDD
jgi:hypothetical protein